MEEINPSSYFYVIKGFRGYKILHSKIKYARINRHETVWKTKDIEEAIKISKNLNNYKKRYTEKIKRRIGYPPTQNYITYVPLV